VIIYEHPFNERIRTYLRLEQLFSRLHELVARTHPVDHHFALTTVFEIMEVGARSDLKLDVLRDLEKQKQTLSSFRGNPSIAQDVLETVLQNMDKDHNYLTTQPGKAGHVLTENDWLMSIRSRVGIPGGTCAFDLPAYFAWQHESETKRQADLQGWVAHLKPLGDSVKILLQLLRDSGVPQKVMANGGQFQQNLPQGRTFHLLRVSLDPSLGLIPEISANRLMVSIRLMHQASDGRLQPCGVDETFELTLCS
jgi:cell division protein ZapD